MAEHGPFQAEADVLRTEAVRAVFTAFDADPGTGKMKPHNLAMLACPLDRLRAACAVGMTGTGSPGASLPFGEDVEEWVIRPRSRRTRPGRCSRP